jgi:hypothetical protein
LVSDSLVSVLIERGVARRLKVAPGAKAAAGTARRKALESFIVKISLFSWCYDPCMILVQQELQ